MSKAAQVIAAFIDKNSREESAERDWLRFAHSTTLTINDNPETEEKDYISDETKTTEIKSYSPAFDQDIAIDKTHEDFVFFNKLRHEYPTYGDAHFDILTVYLMEKQEDGSYYAEVQDSTIAFNDMNCTDAVIDLQVAFCGTRIKGTCSIVEGKPVFKAENEESTVSAE